MKRNFFKKCALLCVLAVLLGGCGEAPDPNAPPNCRVVTRVEVRYTRGRQTAYRRYTDPEKMSHVLNYLRLLHPWLPPVLDPEAVAGHSFAITLTFSDGNSTEYLQKSDQFLRMGGGDWKTIDRRLALGMDRLFVALETDEPEPPGSARA